MRSSQGILLTGMLTACAIDPAYEGKVLPPTAHVAMVDHAQYISHTSSELIFEAGVVVQNYYYVGFDNDYLRAEDFAVSGGEGEYTIESFAGYTPEKSQTPASIFFLIDQSGSWEAVDPFNTRSQAAHKFFQDIAEPHTFLTGAASRQGRLTREPLEFFSTEFGNDRTGNARYLFSLGGRTGGDNAILDAAAEAVEILGAHSQPVRKELVLLVHEKDETSTSSAEGVIALARAHAVAIHVIALGSAPDMQVLAALAQETGGLFAPCHTTGQMVKVLSELERLINGDVFAYRIRIRFNPSEGLIAPGSAGLHRIDVSDPYSDTGYNPVLIKITVPL